MLLSFAEIKKLPVQTESGTMLGYVYDCETDTDSYRVNKYYVRANFLSARQYLINVSQIKAIGTDKIIVEDGVLGEKAMRETAVAE
jgi:sporulation protein YlmC with PRC-barrel domain